MSDVCHSPLGGLGGLIHPAHVEVDTPTYDVTTDGFSKRLVRRVRGTVVSRVVFVFLLGSGREDKGLTQTEDIQDIYSTLNMINVKVQKCIYIYEILYLYY